MQKPPGTTAAWPTEPELVPYAPLDLGFVEALLVLAPHPDDEVFGCGGLLALAAQRRARVRVVVATDGGAGGSAAVREHECRAATRMLLGAEAEDALEFWRLPDRGLHTDDALRARIAALVASFAPNAVVVPSPFEVHPDHRALCRAAVEALAVEPANAPQLMMCEIGQPLLTNALVDITSVIALKQMAMGCFSSQLASQRYDEQILALNRYRAYTLGPGVTHAEAYRRLDLREGGWSVERVIADLGTALQRRMGT